MNAVEGILLPGWAFFLHSSGVVLQAETNWKIIGQVFGRIVMAKIPVVKQAEVSRSLLGVVKLKFPCLRCQSPLTSSREAIAKPDSCPDCGQAFALSPAIERQLAESEAAEAAAKRQAMEAKQQAQAEKEQERERLREEREQAERLRRKQLELQRAERERQQEVESEREGANRKPAPVPMRTDNSEGNASYPSLGQWADRCHASAKALSGLAMILPIAGPIFAGLLASAYEAPVVSAGIAALIVCGLVSIILIMLAFFYFVFSEGIRLAINVAVDTHVIRRRNESLSDG